MQRTGRSTGEGATESEALRALRRKLESEEAAHDQTKRQLAEATALLRSATSTETAGLREKVADQTEQIEALLQEISSLRHEKSFAHSLNEAQAEISRLQREAKELHDKCIGFEKRNIELESELESVYENEAAESRNIPRTATPTTSSVGRNAETIQKEKDKLSKAEDIVEELRVRLSEAYESEASAKEKCAEFERRLIDSDRHIRLLSEKLERTQGEREELEMKLAQNGSDLDGALQRLSAQGERTTEQDAHVWWSYVWHEMRKRHQDKRGIVIDDLVPYHIIHLILFPLLR